MGEAWTDQELIALVLLYPVGGIKACQAVIHRSERAIYTRARTLKLRREGRLGVTKRPVIATLANGNIISICPRHGECEHYVGQRYPRCALCERTHCQRWARTEHGRLNRLTRVRRKLATPLGKYQNRLRASLHRYTDGQVKWTKHLPYTAAELRDHLESIRAAQKNQCPMCGGSYDSVGFDIDHIIPVSSARTEADLLNLYALKNLSLLCPRCNRHVKRDRIMEMAG